MDDDKRNAVRIRKDITIAYSYDDRVWITTDLLNLSENGICITTSRASLIDENIIIRIDMPQRQIGRIELPGKVISSDTAMNHMFKTRIGFLNLNEEQTELLRIFVAAALVKGA